MSQEEWRDVPGYPLYQASNEGRVRSLRYGRVRGLVARQHNGYPHVFVVPVKRQRRKVPVHRLVLMAFKGPPPPDRNITRHLDGVRVNNRPENLAWGTPKENAADAVRHGTAVCRRRGSASPGAKLTEERYAELVRRLETGGRPRDLADEFGVHFTYVYMVKRGEGRGRKRRWR